MTDKINETKHLKERLEQLAHEKSFLQLMISLFNKILPISEIDPLTESILRGILDTIGGTHLALYYRLDGILYYTDITGARYPVDKLEDELVAEVLASGEPLEQKSDFSDTRMITREFTRASTWIYPLKIGSEILGVMKIENIELGMEGLRGHLRPLFGFIAMTLNNEIRSIYRKKAEEDLRRRERILDASQHLAKVGGWEWDAGENLLYWTDETYRIHGLDPVNTHLKPTELKELSLNCYPPEDRALVLKSFQRCCEKGERYDLEVSFTSYTGQNLWVRTTGTPLWEGNRIIRVMGNIMDITERKKYQEEQLRLEKLQSLGVLAGGIAHDFNNILTGILGNVSLAQMYLDTSHRAYQPLEAAEKASARAGELARQLLTFAKGGAPVKKTISVKEVLEEAVSLALRGANVKGILEISPDIHTIDADSGQISQVCSNIIINARQAMPGGGNLSITAQNEGMEEPNLYKLPAGSYVKITFSDEGCGIPEKDLVRIFDPYFTTRREGNGLGLASVQSIIHRHGGFITAASTPNRGSVFTMYLPASGKPLNNNPPRDLVNKQDCLKRIYPVLVMDDEELIRNLVSEMLKISGYCPCTCSDGAAAVELYRKASENGEPFAGVIMDLTVPGGMGGKEAAEKILATDPNACLIVSSGYSQDPVLSEFSAYGFKAAIGKPFKITELQKILSLLLEDK